MEKSRGKVDESSKANYENNLRVLNNPFIRDFLVSKFGENALKIIRNATCAMADDVLANKCKLKIAEVRTFLNRLYELGLSNYTRIKDKEIGWYSYIWEINLENAATVVEREMLKELETLRAQVNSATVVFSYYCPKCSRENIVGFDLAASLGFRCPNCNKQLKELKVDQQKNIDRLHELEKAYNLFRQSMESSS